MKCSDSLQGLAASAEVNTCLERAKVGIPEFAEVYGHLELAQSILSCWDLSSRCRVRLLTLSAAGERGAVFWWSSFHPVVPGDTPCPVPDHHGTCDPPQAQRTQSCVRVMDGASPGPSPHTGGVGGGGVPWDTAQTTFWWVGSSLEFLLCPTTLLPWGHLKRWVEQDPLPASPLSSTGGQTTPLFVFLALAVPLQLFL